MSTKAIEEMLKWAETHSKGFGFGPHPGIAKARAELEAIRKAAKTLDRLHVGDGAFRIRVQVVEAGFTGISWEHPDVKAWSDASALMGAIAKEDA